jgi:molecular chaperone GrpE
MSEEKPIVDNENVEGQDAAQTVEASTEQESAATAKREETDWQDKYLRLYAEFDNFRKRSIRERSDLIRSASRDTLEKLLPIVDDFARAEAAPAEELEAAREGRRLIHLKLTQILEGQGLKSMGVKAGDAFDVDFHEAITRIPAPTPKLSEKVVDVVEQGYTLNDSVVRYAKVVVGQ